MDEGDINHPYAGKRGRHPADCNCPVHAKKRANTNGDAGVTSLPEVSPPSVEVSASPASPPNLDSLLAEGETRSNLVPPLDPKKAAEQVKKDGGVKPKTVKKFYMSPKLLKFIGSKIANITGIEGYRLDDDEAKDIAECMQDVGREKGWGFSAEMSLYVLLFMWLGIPTLEWGVKKWKERKAEKEKEEEKKKKELTTPQLGAIPPQPAPQPEIIPDPGDKEGFKGLKS